MTTAVQDHVFSNKDQQFFLQPDDVAAFTKQGFLGPFPMVSPDEMAVVRQRLESEVFNPDSCERRDYLHNRHIDSRLMYDVATHPAIRHRMASIYGPDLLLWRTNFFNKAPGGLEIPWHQDYNYWPLEPAVIISAWLAIDDVTIENSAVQIVPGSHRQILTHTKALPGMQFGEMADPDGVQKQIEKNGLVNMEMKAGEFFLFNERTLHHSEPNRSQLRRAGLAIRVIVPLVKVLGFDSPDHQLMLIHGEDNSGRNPIMPPPAANY